MGRRPLLEPEVALKLKEDIWNGMDHKGIMEKYKIAYQLSADIKGGRKYEYIPWPDGSTGSMGPIRHRQIADARRYGHAANRRYQDIDEDNSTIGRLKRLGKYEEVSEFVMAKSGCSVEELLTKFNRALERAMDEERMQKHSAQMAALDRHEALMASDPVYKKVWEEQKAKERERELAIHPPRPNLPADQVDPNANERLSWDEVVLLSSAKVVKIAAAEEHEPSLRLAIQIVFKLLSPRQWDEDHCLKMIYSVKQKIERFWELNPDRVIS